MREPSPVDRLKQSVLVTFVLVCCFGIVIQIVDEGGGRSGGGARSRVTIGSRVCFGAFLGGLGGLALAGAISLSRELREPPDDRGT